MEDNAKPNFHHMIFCRPDDEEAGMKALAERIVAHRRRPLMIIASEFIDQSTSLMVHAYARRITPIAQKEGLDVLLHSPGGSLSESYRIARLLSRVCNAWVGMVPWQATSGATLIALGSERLIMGDYAFLGPIDPQVASKRTERFSLLERQSALEAFQALEYLRKFALGTMDATMDFLLSERAVAPEVALRASSELASSLIQPVLERIEPYALGEFSRDTVLSEEYARRVARPTAAERKAQDRTDYKKLVNDYPAHEFMIDREEAESLGWKVEAPDDTLERLFVDAGLELEHNISECVSVTRLEKDTKDEQAGNGRPNDAGQKRSANPRSRRAVPATGGSISEGPSANGTGSPEGIGEASSTSN